MIFGTILLYALVAGSLAFGVEWVLTRLGAPAWVARIAYGLTLVYTFWLLLDSGPLRIGR